MHTIELKFKLRTLLSCENSQSPVCTLSDSNIEIAITSAVSTGIKKPEIRVFQLGNFP